LVIKKLGLDLVEIRLRLSQ